MGKTFFKDVESNPESNTSISKEEFQFKRAFYQFLRQFTLPTDRAIQKYWETGVL